MSRIFISYRREDSAGEAGRIYDYVERKFGREAIFKDVDALAPGDNFQNRINEAVGQCEILLAIIGRRWLQVQDAAGRRRLDNPADWVRLEIETALNRNVRVIPVLLDGVGMPAIHDLPESLQPLCYRNAARVRHDPDFRQDIERILKVIEQHVNGTERQKVEQVTEQLFNSALAKGNARDYWGAIADYDRAIHISPNNALAYNNRGLAKADLGDNRGAIADYNKAIQINPDNAITYYNRALAKYSLSDNRGAITDYDIAIQINPGNALAYYGRGLTKQTAGDNRGAITDYGIAIQINPNYALAYNNRGTAKSKLGDTRGVIVDLKNAIALAQQQGDTYTYNLAQNNLKQIS